MLISSSIQPQWAETLEDQIAGFGLMGRGEWNNPKLGVVVWIHIHQGGLLNNPAATKVLEQCSNIIAPVVYYFINIRRIKIYLSTMDTVMSIYQLVDIQFTCIRHYENPVAIFYSFRYATRKFLSLDLLM